MGSGQKATRTKGHSYPFTENNKIFFPQIQSAFFVQICDENFRLTAENFRQSKNFRLWGAWGAAAPTPSNTLMVV